MSTKRKAITVFVCDFCGHEIEARQKYGDKDFCCWPANCVSDYRAARDINARRCGSCEHFSKWSHDPVEYYCTKTDKGKNRYSGACKDWSPCYRFKGKRVKR